jgi:hypothetical protein
MNSKDIKICTKCNELKSILEFEKQKRNQSGIGSRCKRCASKTSGVWEKEHPESWRNKPQRRIYLKNRQKAFKEHWKFHNAYEYTSFKICAKCKTNKLGIDFFKSGCSNDGLQAYCKKCLHTRHVRNPARQMLVNARARAKKKNIEFTIIESDIIIPKKCPVLNIELNPGKGQRQSSSPTIDRFDNNIGYTPTNIRIISYRANTLKSNATIEEVEYLLRYMKNESPNTI